MATGRLNTQTEHFMFVVTPRQVLRYSGIIIPRRYITTPFDLTPEEWTDLQTTLLDAKQWIEAHCRPDGFNIGWNVGTAAGQEVEHLHLHVIPRFSDEPLAGKGIRAHLKQAAKDPAAIVNALDS